MERGEKPEPWEEPRPEWRREVRGVWLDDHGQELPEPEDEERWPQIEKVNTWWIAAAIALVASAIGAVIGVLGWALVKVWPL